MFEPNQDEIHDFDALFVKNEQKNDSKHNLDIGKGRSFLMVGIYFFIVIILSFVVQLALILTNTGIITTTSEEQMLIEVEGDTLSLGYLNTDTNVLISEYDVAIIYQDNDYLIIANQQNPHLLDTYTLEQIKDLFQTDEVKWVTDNLDTVVHVYTFKDDLTFRQYYDIELSNTVYNDGVSGSIGFTSMAATLFNFSIYVLLALALIPIGMITLKTDFKVYKPKYGYFNDILIGYAIMFGFAAAALIVGQFIAIIFNYTPVEAINQQGVEEALTSNVGFLMAIVTVFFAPILEELIFRKAMFSLISNTALALILSSLLFGFTHVASETTLPGFLINLLSYSASGFALGYIYIKNNRNIYASILIHLVYNAIAVILVFTL